MQLFIPRGIIHHSLKDDIFSLFRVFYSNLSEKEYINHFEELFAKYMGKDFCTAFPLARTAIYYALKERSFSPGTEIIMPPISIKGILDVILDLGLKPVFVDINKDTFCFDIKQLEESVSPATKAILITYLFGMVPNIYDLIAFSKKNNLFVIEDFSQCLNGKYKNKKVGGFGDVGVYSSSSLKTLDTYGGGLLVYDRKNLNKKMEEFKMSLKKTSRFNLFKKILINFTRNTATQVLVFDFIVYPLLRALDVIDPGSYLKQTGSRDQKMIKKLPSSWFDRFSSLQARIGLRYLKKVVGSDKERIKNVNQIKIKAPDVNFPKEVEGATNVYWVLIAYFNQAVKVQSFFQSKKVDTATSSLELISLLSDYPYRGNTPNAQKLHDCGLFIPAHAGLSTDQIDKVAEVSNKAALAFE